MRGIKDGLHHLPGANAAKREIRSDKLKRLANTGIVWIIYIE
jgi:hypothetical protein